MGLRYSPLTYAILGLFGQCLCYGPISQNPATIPPQPSENNGLTFLNAASDYAAANASPASSVASSTVPHYWWQRVQNPFVSEGCTPGSCQPSVVLHVPSTSPQTKPSPDTAPTAATLYTGLLNLNTSPYQGCAAALKCVPDNYCTVEGTASNTPVVLTKELYELRVPLSDCQDPASGIIGKCCRDPNYKDPWPTDGQDNEREHVDANVISNENTYNGITSYSTPESSVYINHSPSSTEAVTPISAFKPSTSEPNLVKDYGSGDSNSISSYPVDSVPSQLPTSVKPTSSPSSYFSHSSSTTPAPQNNPPQSSHPSYSQFPSKPLYISQTTFPSKPYYPKQTNYPTQTNNVLQSTSLTQPTYRPSYQNQPAYETTIISHPQTTYYPLRPIYTFHPPTYPTYGPPQTALVPFHKPPQSPSYPGSQNPPYPSQNYPSGGYPQSPNNPGQQPYPPSQAQQPTYPQQQPYPPSPSPPQQPIYPGQQYPSSPQKPGFPEQQPYPPSQPPIYPGQQYPPPPSPPQHPSFPGQQQYPHPPSPPQQPTFPGQQQYPSSPSPPQQPSFPGQQQYPSSPSPPQQPSFPGQQQYPSSPSPPQQPSFPGQQQYPSPPSPPQQPSFPGQQQYPSSPSPPQQPSFPGQQQYPSPPSPPQQPSFPGQQQYPSPPPPPQQPSFPGQQQYPSSPSPPQQPSFPGQQQYPSPPSPPQQPSFPGQQQYPSPPIPPQQPSFPGQQQYPSSPSPPQQSSFPGQQQHLSSPSPPQQPGFPGQQNPPLPSPQKPGYPIIGPIVTEKPYPVSTSPSTYPTRPSQTEKPYITISTSPFPEYPSAGVSQTEHPHPVSSPPSSSPGYPSYGSQQPSYPSNGGVQPGYPTSGPQLISHPGGSQQPGYPSADAGSQLPNKPQIGSQQPNYPPQSQQTSIPSPQQPGLASQGNQQAGHPFPGQQPGYPIQGQLPSYPSYPGSTISSQVPGPPSGNQYPGYPAQGSQQPNYPGLIQQPNYPNSGPPGYPYPGPTVFYPHPGQPGVQVFVSEITSSSPIPHNSALYPLSSQQGAIVPNSQRPHVSIDPGVTPALLLKEFAGPCGVKANDGTAYGEASWHAIVYSSKNKDLICGGAIVSENAILTTAHCLDHSESDSTQVKIGPQGKVHHVQAIVRHSKYDRNTYNRDLALVILKEPIQFDSHIGKICLPTTVSQMESLDRDCYVSTLTKELEPKTLKSITVQVFPYKDCESKLKNTYLGKYFVLNDSFSCGSSPTNEELCTVKTGSPIACNKGDGTYELFGLKSWDLGCQEYKKSAIFSNFDIFWVRSMLGMPTSKLIANEQAYLRAKFRGETLEGVKIEDKPGFNQGYGK